MKTTKKDFKENVSLNKTWNRAIEWNGLVIATVHYHHLVWKILKSKEDYRASTERDFIPVAEFHTQEELWQHIKSNC